MSEYCLGFAFSKSLDRVILIKKKKPEWQAGKLNGIGGKMEPMESSVGAMAREFMEETGLHVPERDWTRVGRLQFGDTAVHLFTAAIDWITSIPRRDCSEGRVAWIFWDGNTERPVIPNLRWIIPLCRCALRPGEREVLRFETPQPE